MTFFFDKLIIDQLIITFIALCKHCISGATMSQSLDICQLPLTNYEEIKLTANNSSLASYIHTPGFPHNYSHNLDCAIIIKAPKRCRIEINFLDIFDLEPSPDCKYDQLEIRDGSFGYSQLIGIFCGSKFPNNLLSRSSSLWLRFKTDVDLNYRGFKIAVHFVENKQNQNLLEIPSCILNLTNQDGIIRTEHVPVIPRLFSSLYKVPLDCSWILDLQSQNEVAIEIPNFADLQKASCSLASLEIYYPTSSASNLIHSFCDQVISKGTTPQYLNTKTLINNAFTKSKIVKIQQPILQSIQIIKSPEKYVIFLKSLKNVNTNVYVHLRIDPSFVNSNESHDIWKHVLSCPTNEEQSCGTGKHIIFTYTIFRSGKCDSKMEFECDNVTCIDSKLRCNGHTNCPNAEDEINCPTPDEITDLELEFKLNHWFRNHFNIIITAMLFISSFVILLGAYATYRSVIKNYTCNPLTKIYNILRLKRKLVKSFDVGPPQPPTIAFVDQKQASPKYTNQLCTEAIFRSGTVLVDNKMSRAILSKNDWRGSTGEFSRKISEIYRDHTYHNSMSSQNDCHINTDDNEEFSSLNNISDSKTDFYYKFSDFNCTPPRYKECMY